MTKTDSHLNRRGFLSLAGATLAITGAGSFTLRSAQAGLVLLAWVDPEGEPEFRCAPS